MAELNSILAVIPARGGSKGLPGKNIRPLGGIPLIGHAIRVAQELASVTEIICSTDAEPIATIARQYGAKTPFLRPAELAQDDTPMWPVLKHALTKCDPQGTRFDALLLLDPTCPGRTPDDIARAIHELGLNPHADGIVSVSEYEDNPIWYAVVNRDGFMADLMPEARQYSRRQDVPPAYRINGSVYLWRTAFVHQAEDWREGRNLLLATPAERSVAIDTEADFLRAEALLAKGLILSPNQTR